MNEKLQQIRENAVAQIEAADSLEKLKTFRKKTVLPSVRWSMRREQILSPKWMP